jgi:hypothetical protein
MQDKVRLKEKYVAKAVSKAGMGGTGGGVRES